jgi:abortive infection bacteriophage resistance protein
MYLADSHFLEVSSHVLSDEIQLSSFRLLMKLKGFLVWTVSGLSLLDICYQTCYSIKHHIIQMYLAVKSLNVLFFSLIDNIKTSLQWQICHSIEHNYLVAALILSSHTSDQVCLRSRVYQLNQLKYKKKIPHLPLEYAWLQLA